MFLSCLALPSSAFTSSPSSSFSSLFLSPLPLAPVLFSLTATSSAPPPYTDEFWNAG